MNEGLICVLEYFINEIQSSLNDFDDGTKDSIKKTITNFFHGKITLLQADESLSLCNASEVCFDVLNRIRTVRSLENSPSPLQKMRQNEMSKKTRPWTLREDNRLLAGMALFGLDWTKVAEFVGNGRSRGQCSQRWVRGLNPKISKETWTVEEEKKLIKLVEENGQKCWSRISQLMGNRSDVQCRYMFRQITRKNKHLMDHFVLQDDRPQKNEKTSNNVYLSQKKNIIPDHFNIGNHKADDKMKLPTIYEFDYGKPYHSIYLPEVPAKCTLKSQGQPFPYLLDDTFDSFLNRFQT